MRNHFSKALALNTFPDFRFTTPTCLSAKNAANMEPFMAEMPAFSHRAHPSVLISPVVKNSITTGSQARMRQLGIFH